MKYQIVFTLALLMSAITSFAKSEDPASSWLEHLIEPYLQVQKHLAADDLSGAQAEAKILLEALASQTHTGSSHQPGAVVSESAMKIQDSSDLQSARVAFRELSGELLEWVEQDGSIGAKTLYVVRCPMAFGNEGASWLQDGKTVSNPYYGASMLRCGSIEKEIDAQSGEAATDAHHHH